MGSNELAGFTGFAEGVKDILVPWMQNNIKNDQEMGLYKKKSAIDEQSKINVVQKTPRDVWNPETKTFETRYGGAITQLKTPIAEKQAKTKIPYNEFIKRFNSGENITSDKYEVVPQAYAGSDSSIVAQNKQKQIKSYQDSFNARPEIK
jgi:hypothetical protein